MLRALASAGCMASVAVALPGTPRHLHFQEGALDAARDAQQVSSLMQLGVGQHRRHVQLSSGALGPLSTMPQHLTPDIMLEYRSGNGEVEAFRQLLVLYIATGLPLGAIWMIARKVGDQRHFQNLLLPLSLCLGTIQVDLFNQALSIWMQSPMGITAFQALVMAVVSAFCTGIFPNKYAIFSWDTLPPLRIYFPAATAFAAYQIINHQVSYTCTLSERVVMLNLVPAAMLLLESAVLPVHLRQKVSWAKCACLGSMVLGAAMFAIEYPGFTPQGVTAALCLLGITLPYRLTQRYLLDASRDLSIPFLCIVDGMLLTSSASVVMEVNMEKFWAPWYDWLHVSYVVVALVLSALSMTVQHSTSLKMLRDGSATTYQVFYNMSNCVLIFLGVVLFHDRILEGPLVLCGTIISLLGGAAYAVVAQAELADPKDSITKLEASLGSTSSSTLD